MFGVSKKVEKVRAALVDALTRKATTVLQSKDNGRIRAMVLIDLADVLGSLSIDKEIDGE